ncbi:Ig-like domain-containing protein [Shewanella marina]|uniref:Ig-like domain-containing protein n=1 Tax=Shewanella marina TaxID=487319 RepID=UPI0004707BE3|nr:Ig-like domain-containing protein [Shewanella marina]
MSSKIKSPLLWPLYQSIIIACIALMINGCDSRGFMGQETPSASIDDTLQIIPITQVAGTDAIMTQIGLPFQFIAVDIIDGEYQVVSDKVTWYSSDTKIATVQQGRATALTKGHTKIQVQLGQRLSNTIELEVRDEPMLVLQIKTGEEDHPIGTLYNQLPINAKQSLVAIATYADHTSFNVSQHVEWFSTQANIVNIERAVAHMRAKGKSDIYAVYLNEYKSNTLPFIVTDATLEFLKISPATATTAAHSHRNFTAIATYSDYTSQNVTQYVDWHSSQNNIATITRGEAEALTPGRSQITASLLGMTSSPSTLTVTDAQLVRLQITPSEPALDLGESLFFNVKAIYDDGSTDDVTNHALWQSSQPNVSNVAAGYTKANNVGHTEISASLHNIKSNKATLTVNDHQLTALQVTPALVELAQGTQAELKVIARYDDNTTRDITDKVTWQSHSPEVALIDHGHISAITVGNTHIHAVFDGIKSNDAEITVIDANVTALQITPAIETVPVNGVVDYVAQATFSDGQLTTTQDVSHLVAWKSQHHDIATLAHGAAIGVQPGEAKILAVLNETYQTANLKVIDKHITALQVTPAVQTIAKGTMSQYRAIATYDDNSSEDVTDLVNWSSSDSNIATLYSGALEAVDVGQVTINANYLNVSSNQAQLTIEDIQLTAIQITPPNEEIQVGTSTSYKATGLYSNDTSRDITDLVHWNSSDTDVTTILLNQVTLNTEQAQLASVTEDISKVASETQDSDNIFAIASGISAGSAFISADLNGIESNQAQLTVNAASLQSLQITPAI